MSEKKRAGQWAEATGAKRGRELYYVAPEKVTVDGVDNDRTDSEFHDDRGVKAARREAPYYDPGMVVSIAATGVQRIVEVVPRGEELVVRDGRRRVIHARIANEQRVAAGMAPIRVRVEVVSESDPKENYLAARRANAYAVKDGPLQIATHARREMHRKGITEEEHAEAENISVATLRQYLTLLKLDPSVQEAVETGKIAPTAAAALVAMPASKQLEYLARAEAGEAVTVEKVHKDRAERNAKKHGKGLSAPLSRRDVGRVIGMTTSTAPDGTPPLALHPVALRTLKIVYGTMAANAVEGMTAALRRLGRDVGDDGGE